MRFTYFLFFVGCALIASFFYGCDRTNGSKSKVVVGDTVRLDPQRTIIFLNKTASATAIGIDTLTPFFERINNLDMSLQMGSDYTDSQHDSLRHSYIKFLKQHTLSFTNAEKAELLTSVRETYFYTNALSPTLLPKTLYFIKIDGEGYGKDIFYTRNANIIIPEKELKAALAGDTVAFRRTITHEVFHVISRYHTKLQAALYAAIGFDTMSTMRVPEVLLKKLLVNPDGVNMQYRMKLSDTLQGVMLTYSRPLNARSEFFEHFKSDMFQVKRRGGAWEVIADTLGESTLANAWQEPFFKQIGTNTEYYIHPDEILAENFALLIASKKPNKKGNPDTELDAEGRQLLMRLEKIFKKQ